MSIEIDRMWIYPDGEVAHGAYVGYRPLWKLFAGKPVGTLLCTNGYWVERLPHGYRQYPQWEPPAHIKLRCLLLGIQP